MSKKGSVKFHNPSDPRTRTVKDLNVGDALSGSTVRLLKSQKRGGRMGVRITLADFRTAWAPADRITTSLKFEHRGKRS